MFSDSTSRSRLAVVPALAMLLAGVATAAAGAPKPAPARSAGTAVVTPAKAVAPATASSVRTLSIDYRAHDGRTSQATVLVPSWYGPRRHPALPLVISPHGRGLSGRTNAKLWGSLPTRGDFAVVNPDGEGERLSGRFSWGAPGQIEDLARMPQIVAKALPWLKLDRERVYAVGGSMGGQETLLLLGTYPRLLAGAVVVDPCVNFLRQYRNFASFKCDATCRSHWGGPIGNTLQRLALREVGGAPDAVPAKWERRNVLNYAGSIARSGVPLQIWWSRADAVISPSSAHSGLLIKQIRGINPHAPLTVRTGSWRHTRPLRWDRQLPRMLAGLGLLGASRA